MRSSTHDKTVSTPFKLKLPEPFNKLPKYIVQLPAKREAYIYDDKADDMRHGLGVTLYGWRVVVMHNGKLCTRAHYRGNYSSHEYFYSNPLDVKLALEGFVLQYTPKPRPVRTGEDYEDD